MVIAASNSPTVSCADWDVSWLAVICEIFCRRAGQAGGSARGVVVLRVQPLGARVREVLGEGGRLRRRFAIAQPGDFVVAVVVEGGPRSMVTRGARPAQERKLRLRHGGPPVVGVVRRVGRGTRLEMPVASADQ